MYEENEKKLQELRIEESKIKDELKREFLDYYKSKHPKELEYLEGKLGDEIESVKPVQYIYDASYCNVLCINTKAEKRHYEFALDWSEEWDADTPIANIIYNIVPQDGDMLSIIDGIFEIYPFIDTEYLN